MPFAIRDPSTRAGALPIRRSAYGFCQGDLGDIGRSRIPLARIRLVKACP
jgi:hypothetical protein